MPVIREFKPNQRFPVVFVYRKDYTNVSEQVRLLHSRKNVNKYTPLTKYVLTSLGWK